MAKVATLQESVTIPFNAIEVDPDFNCRTSYEDIEELTESIRSQGLITPLTVTMNGGDTYKLVSGFRRYQALKNLKTGEKHINVVIRKFDSDSDLHLANLVE
ncbi:MAG: ParB/RepB/Spo0J family partition protein, partial [bacterium]